MTCNNRSHFLAMGIALLAVVTCVGCRSQDAEPADTAQAALAPIVASWPMTITDDLGGTVTLDAPPERVVSLSPAVTEMLYAVGAGDRVVGRTSFCDYPPEALDVAEVGTFTTPSTEKVLELQPDLCIGVRGVTKDAIQALRDVGLKVIAYDPLDIEKTLNIMEQLGRLIQESPAPVAVVDDLRVRVEAVRADAAKLPRKPRVLVGVQFQPLYAAGPGTHIHDMIETAGGENTVADADLPWPQYSLERMVEKDPEIIIGTPTMADFGDQTLLEGLKGLAGWSTMTAVRRENVVMVDDDILTLPGPRMVDGLEELAVIIAEVARGETAE